MQTALVALVPLSMIGSMVSGVILSRHALSFLPIDGGHAFARTLHMLSGYGGFVFMSLYLGFHWNTIVGVWRKAVKKPSKPHPWMLRIVEVLIAGYGAWAFLSRDIGSYMFLKNQFVFFNFEEPIMLFLLDYIAVMGLFVMAGHYLHTISKRSKRQNRIGYQNQINRK